MPNPNLTYLRKLTALEKVYLPKVTKHLKAEIAAFVQEMNALGREAALQNISATISTDFQPLMETMHRKGGLMGARLTQAELKPLLRERKKAAGFGRNPEWERRVLEVLRLTGLEFVLDISDTSKEYILNTFEQAIEQNWTYEQIVDKLTHAGYWEARARRIVRTELVRAANIGHQEAARDFPFEVNKKWLAAADHRTRHSHHKVHNQAIGEDDLFRVPIYKGDKLTGYEEMNAPGDPKASAGNTINCRCRVLHEAKRDAKGNLIERNRNQARIIPMRSTEISNQSIRAAIAASVKSLVD